MSAWRVWVVDGDNNRLTTPESDYVIPSWHWEGEELHADIEGQPEMVVGEDIADFTMEEKKTRFFFTAGTKAHAFRLQRLSGAPVEFSAAFNYDVHVQPGYKLQLNSIKVEGGCVALIEEYLFLR